MRTAGAYAADLVFRCVTDHDPHGRLFDAMIACLGDIDEFWGDRVAILGAVLGFQWATLAETGYTPSLGVDVRTGEPLADDEARYGFDPRLGGVTRDPGGHRAGPGEVWRVRGETIRRLRRLAAEGGLSEPSDPGTSNQDLLVRCVRFLAAWIATVTGESPGSQRAILDRFGRK